MAALASFINVHEAVLLSIENKKILWQVWRDHAPGFSALHELGHDSPIEVLNQLAPPRFAPEPDPVAHPFVAEKRWYMQTRVHLGVAAVAVLAFLGGYVWAHYAESARPWSPDIKGFGGPTSP
jgi:hypothetical protein